MDIDKIKQMVKTGKDYYYKSRSGNEFGNGPYISFNSDTDMYNLHSGGFIVQKSKNFDVIFSRGKELLGESVKLKRSTEIKLRKMVEKILKEEYSGTRIFYSEKAAIEDILRRKFPMHNMKYVQKSSPNGSVWQTFVPTWNSRTPSNEYNPTIEYSYKIVVEKGQRFPSLHWWLNKKNYKE